ncbi:hypothetical protein WL89_30930 [Burkholderia cenocepacia]|nr:hypothetical protein WL89_30930 [Burkholderia cenocepacia]
MAEVSGECFIVIGHGETDIPEAKIVMRRGDLLDAVLSMIYGSQLDAPADERAMYAQDLEDEDQWAADRWSCEFEIGGIIVWHVGLHPFAPQPAHADAPIDIEAMLCACVPGGDICDPQRVADSIREWFAELGVQADAPAEARQWDAIRYVHADGRRTGWIDSVPPRHVEMLNEGFRVEYAYIGSAPADAGEATIPRVHGISRFADNPCTVLVKLMAEPSDDALRAIHNMLTAPPAARVARLTREQKATINWAIRAAVEAGYTSDADVLRALLAPTQQPSGEVTGGRTYPDEMSPALRDVLGRPNFWCGPIAHEMRAAGAEIKTKAEDEQAHVLHWLVKLVLDHGDDWQKHAATDLRAIREKADAARAQGGES